MRVVLVGNGMAGARLAEELRRRQPAPDRLRVTVFGAELDPAYNRVLLGGVLAGTIGAARTRLYPPDWARRNHLTVHRGQPVTAVDPDALSVTPAGGRRVNADAIVLATGSRPRIPDIPGLRGPGVAALRTLADCRRILAMAGDRPVAVLGGGVLGLEAARALATRGIPVTVLHPTGYLMNRQLDAEAGGVLAAELRRLGVRVVLGAAAARWQHGRGIVTDAGELIACRTVVVSAGAVPETDLADAAGIKTDGGILVDDRLESSAPGVYAIGDCARHPGAVSGFVQPAWDQAAVLADLLTGADPDTRYRGTRAVTRLKDRDIHLAAIGDAARPDSGDDEVIRFSDPTRGRYAKLVVRGDRVAGAIMLGVPDAAATVTRLFDSGSPVPADRLAVLLGRAYPAGPGTEAVHQMPDDAIVCRCNTVHKGQLAAAFRAGATDVPALAAATRATTGCGSCEQPVAGFCEWLRNEARPLDSGEGVA
jgi:assimilatory nitrate reductase electron transfer subunit